MKTYLNPFKEHLPIYAMPSMLAQLTVFCWSCVSRGSALVTVTEEQVGVGGGLVYWAPSSSPFMGLQFHAHFLLPVGRKLPSRCFYWTQVIFLHFNSPPAKSLQSCPTLCDPIDGSPPGSPVPGILQARTLEWVAISFSKVWKWKVKVKSLSCVRLSATPWTAAHQAPPSMGFSRQEYWSGLPLPSLNSPPRECILVCLDCYTAGSFNNGY